MDEDLSSFDDSVFDESISQPIELLYVFLCAAVEVKVEVLEVFCSLCVLLACHIQDVGDPCFKQVSSLEA